MKENVENLQFSDQCSYALIESFNSIEKSFDPYHIALVIKSFKNLRNFFEAKALKEKNENILKLKENNSLIQRINIYKNLDQVLGTKIPAPLLACISNLYLNKKLDSLEQLQKRYYFLSNKVNKIQIVDEVFTSSKWDENNRQLFKEKLENLLENNKFKEIIIKKKTIQKDLLGGMVIKINSQLIDCSTNNLIRIQLRNHMKVN
jgi:F0F1-type ATP synthase delta subunit